jgi:cytochrome c553
MKIRIITLVLILSTASYAQTASNQPEVPAAMVGFLDEIENLQPLMVSAKRFSATENQFNIQTRLNHLAEISNNLKHEQRLGSPFFSVMTDILPMHMEELKESFKDGHKEYARTMLNATLDACSSCHGQVKAKQSHLWRFSPDTIKGSTFEKAEFLFAVRQYDEAYPRYQKVVLDFKPTSATPLDQEVQDALSRKLSILIRSKRNLAEAYKEIERDISKPNLPAVVKSALKSDLASVKQLQKITVPNLTTAKSKDMETFAARTLGKSTDISWSGNKNGVPHLFVSGILYEYVQLQPFSEIGPGIYYWLAKCEKRISKNYFFPVAEFYLKECIERFPLSYEAKLCFNELEENTYNNFARKP